MSNEHIQPNHEPDSSMDELSLAEHEAQGPESPPQWEPDDAEKMRKVADDSKQEYEDRINDENRGYISED